MKNYRSLASAIMVTAFCAVTVFSMLEGRMGLAWTALVVAIIVSMNE